MVAGWEVSLKKSMKGMVPEAAKSVANRELPPMPEDNKPDADGKYPVTLCLMYQYIEPAWSAKEHRAALSFVNALARKHGVTGRGRCAAEGLNCTLTGPAQGVRDMAMGLREWNPIFNETDFKLTDGLDPSKRFKSFTLQKKEELVAYGLPTAMAPSLRHNETKHVEADEYHKMMADSNTVIIDVRNRYETEIGHFQPPPGGAEFIDPKVRNSHEFPKWLSSPDVQDKLAGKKIMMYCTGGIRCERFSALLSQIKEEKPDFQTEGEFMVRGGIERYMKTFPEGGYWKGKNYLFDKRQEQVPENKPAEELEKEIESCCCVCKRTYGIYRGSFKCCVSLCMVPVIVCPECTDSDPARMKCPLCIEGYSLRELDTPKLKEAAKRKEIGMSATTKRAEKRAKFADKEPSKRLFVGNLPLVIDATTIKNTLGGMIDLVHWIPDRGTGLWYGSTFVQMSTQYEASQIVRLARENQGIKIGKRKLRINFAPPTEDEVWPPSGFKQLERPPIPVNPGKPAT